MDNDGVRLMVVRVLDAMIHEDEAELPEPLAWLADTGLAGLHAAVLELGTAVAEVIRALAGIGPVSVALTDVAHGGLDIDDCPPPLRAATRILLALANDHPGDADLQWTLVRAGAPGDLPAVFLHLAVWAVHLLAVAEAAGATDTAVPAWLRHLDR